jgi:hypothetical protein
VAAPTIQSTSGLSTAPLGGTFTVNVTTPAGADTLLAGIQGQGAYYSVNIAQKSVPAGAEFAPAQTRAAGSVYSISFAISSQTTANSFVIEAVTGTSGVYSEPATLQVGISSAGTTGITVSGQVTDTGGAGVAGATIAIAGSTVTAVSLANGDFTISNVPANATGFSVAPPIGGTYLVHYVGYQGTTYGSTGNQCSTLPLPTLSQGVNTLPADVELFSSSSPPPAPPTCSGS